MLKKTVQSLFGLLGLSVSRKRKQKATGFSMVKVGNFSLRINNNNGIKYCYEHVKDYGAQLPRLTAFLYHHHTGLQAVDVGANLGDSVALIKTGADVPVTAIEGDHQLVELFRANTVKFQNVELIDTFFVRQPRGNSSRLFKGRP